MKKLLLPMLALALGAGCGWSPAPSPRPGESGPSKHSTQYWPTDASGKKPAVLPGERIHSDHPKASPSAVALAPRAAPQVKKPAYGLPLVIQSHTPEVPAQLLKPSPPIEDLP
jgi:hypothetical protein